MSRPASLEKYFDSIGELAARRQRDSSHEICSEALYCKSYRCTTSRTLAECVSGAKLLGLLLQIDNALVRLSLEFLAQLRGRNRNFLNGYSADSFGWIPLSPVA